MRTTLIQVSAAAILVLALGVAFVLGVVERDRLIEEAAENYKALERENERLLLETDTCHMATQYLIDAYPCCYQCDEPIDVTRECYWP